MEEVSNTEVVDALATIESEMSFEMSLDARETMTDAELVEAAEQLRE
jgi:hypothetical protein